MTIGKLLEMLMSNLGIVRGQFVDASPFRPVNARWAIKELLKSGYGTEEIMIDGTTGVPMTRPWFIGSCFYQTLKHMVLDKITVRQRGQRAILTRQPMDGRANQGGQRMGEMEKDAFLAHGAAFSLDDRSRIASDAHNALVCSNCGQIGDMKEEPLKIKEAAAILARKNKSKNLYQEDEEEEENESENDVNSSFVGMDSLKCRLCSSSNMVVLPSTYCYTRLLVPEIATCGIKVVHEFGDDQKSNLIGLEDELINNFESNEESVYEKLLEFEKIQNENMEMNLGNIVGKMKI